MKHILFFLLLLSSSAQAQYDTITYPQGVVFDSVIYTFNGGDTLTKVIYNDSFHYYFDTADVVCDTASCTLWKIGSTIKPFFSSDSIRVNGIMTDTANPYPPNANDYFVLHTGYIYNPIFNIWHRDQMDSLHAGGIIEFSTDSGMAWMNVANCSSFVTQNMYTATDTIFSGDAAFTGTSNAEQLTRFQFFNCMGDRLSATACPGWYSPVFFFRFRFVSDSTVDSLAGWIIDSISVEAPGCIPGGVAVVNKSASFEIVPNPAQNIISITSSETIYQVAIINMLGQRIYNSNNAASEMTIDIADLPKGIYTVQVNNSLIKKLVKE